MTAHTQHPISAPPAAPIREKTGHLLLRGWCILVLAGALSGTSLLMVLGPVAAGVAVGAVAALLGSTLRRGAERRSLQNGWSRRMFGG